MSEYEKICQKPNLEPNLDPMEIPSCILFAPVLYASSANSQQSSLPQHSSLAHYSDSTSDSTDTDENDNGSSDEEKAHLATNLAILHKRLKEIKRKRLKQRMDDEKAASQRIEMLNVMKEAHDESQTSQSVEADGLQSIEAIKEQIEEQIIEANDGLRMYKDAKNKLNVLLPQWEERMGQDPAESVIEGIQTSLRNQNIS